MANPYHDADGKFCSRGEMVKAIDLALETKNIDTYFELRRDLELIDSNKVEVSQELFGQLMEKNTAQKQKDRIEVENPEDYRSVYQTILGSDEEEHSKHRKLNTLLQNRELPEELRQEIVDNADEATQLAILRSASKFYSTAPTALLTYAQGEKLVNQNIENANAIQDALQHDFPLRDEKKLELAERYDWGLAELVSSSPTLLQRPGMEQQFLNKMQEVKDAKSSSYGQYARVLAKHSKNLSVIKSLLREEDTHGAASASLHNVNTDGETAALAFTRLTEKTYQLQDMPRLWQYEFRGGSHLYRDESNLPGISWKEATAGASFKDGSPTVSEIEALNNPANENVGRAQAVVDSYRGNYVKLQAKLFKEEKLSRKTDNAHEVEALKTRLDVARKLVEANQAIRKLRFDNKRSVFLP